MKCQNHSAIYTDIDKSCPSRKIFTSQICLLTFFTKIKFMQNLYFTVLSFENSVHTDQIRPADQDRNCFSSIQWNYVNSFLASSDFCHLLIIFANSFNPDLDRHKVGHDQDSNCFDTLIVILKELFEKVYLEKSANDNKSMKNYPACRVFQKCNFLLNMVTLCRCKLVWILISLLISLPPGKLYMLFCPLLILFCKINFFEKFFQKYHLSVKQIGSRSGPTFCQAWSGSNLFAKAKNRRH